MIIPHGKVNYMWCSCTLLNTLKLKQVYSILQSYSILYSKACHRIVISIIQGHMKALFNGMDVLGPYVCVDKVKSPQNMILWAFKVSRTLIDYFLLYVLIKHRILLKCGPRPVTVFQITQKWSGNGMWIIYAENYMGVCVCECLFVSVCLIWL